MNIGDLRKYGKKLGRKELAERALVIAHEIIAADNYKDAVKGAGQLKVIADACSYDDYWGEKTRMGINLEEEKISYAAGDGGYK